jgi:serine phosphatase RsbU (regulator of sigma subunit)
MDRMDEIEERWRLPVEGDGAYSPESATQKRDMEDVAWLIALVRELSALHADALAGWNKSIDRVAELGAERNEARALALGLAEALESSQPVFANALQVAIDMMRSGEPWSEAMADKMRAVVSEWCETANAALASPALLRLKGGV